MTHIEQMAKLLEENKGEKEVIVSFDLLLGFTSELSDAAQAGRELSECRTAVANAKLNSRTLDTIASFWREVVAPPNMKGISTQAIEALYRRSLGYAQAMMPSTVAMPQDSCLEMAMLAMLMTIRDYLR